MKTQEKWAERFDRLNDAVDTLEKMKAESGEAINEYKDEVGKKIEDANYEWHYFWHFDYRGELIMMFTFVAVIFLIMYGTLHFEEEHQTPEGRWKPSIAEYLDKSIDKDDIVPAEGLSTVVCTFDGFATAQKSPYTNEYDWELLLTDEYDNKASFGIDKETYNLLSSRYIVGDEITIEYGGRRYEKYLYRYCDKDKNGTLYQPADGEEVKYYYLDYKEIYGKRE